MTKKEKNNERIFVHNNPEDEVVLRTKAKKFNFDDLSFKEIRELVALMRKVMKRANGVGLSANQIGLPYRMFVAGVPDSDGGTKYYTVFNPELEKLEDKIQMEEGCLSVPGKYGQIERYDKVVLKGQDARGKALKIRAWGLLAQVFQHELGHLNGELFIDKAKSVRDVSGLKQALKEEE